MARCNPTLMDQFNCDQLREKRYRADATIARDQAQLDRTNSRIRQNRRRIADHEARILRLRGELPNPSIPGPVERDNDRRPKKPSVADIFVDSAEEIARQIRNRQEIQRLERDIDRLEGDIQDLLPDQTRQVQSLSDALAGRSCILDAMRRKGCVGA